MNLNKEGIYMSENDNILIDFISIMNDLSKVKFTEQEEKQHKREYIIFKEKESEEKRLETLNLSIERCKNVRENGFGLCGRSGHPPKK